MPGRSKDVPPALQRESHGVEASQHETVRNEQRYQGPRRREPTKFVRHELNEDRVAPRDKQLRKLTHKLIVARKRSHLATVLGQWTAGHDVVSSCFGIEGHSLAIQNDSQGRENVVQ